MTSVAGPAGEQPEEEQQEEEQNNSKSDNRAIDRADRRYSRHERENRFLVKRSEDYQVQDEVFDMPTLMAIRDMVNDGIIKSVQSHFASGKEAKVYLAVAPDGTFLALKIYLTVSAEFKKRLQYIAGDPRFADVKKGSTRSLIAAWARKEFRNMQAARDAGVSVPAPVAVKKNVLAMEFLGDSGGNAAPALVSCKEVTFDDYREVLRQAALLYQKAGLVHADLSEYNIFKAAVEPEAGGSSGDGGSDDDGGSNNDNDDDRNKKQGTRLVLFDFGSAVDVKHPNAKQFLVRDVVNINRFFEKRGIEVMDASLALEKIMGAGGTGPGKENNESKKERGREEAKVSTMKKEEGKTKQQ